MSSVPRPLPSGRPRPFSMIPATPTTSLTAHRSSHARTSAVGQPPDCRRGERRPAPCLQNQQRLRGLELYPSQPADETEKHLPTARHPTVPDPSVFCGWPRHVADVWLGNGDGTSKTRRLEDHPGLRRGARAPSIIPGVRPPPAIPASAAPIRPPTPYYCGYYALEPSTIR